MESFSSFFFFKEEGQFSKWKSFQHDDCDGGKSLPESRESGVIKDYACALNSVNKPDQQVYGSHWLQSTRFGFSLGFRGRRSRGKERGEEKRKMERKEEEKGSYYGWFYFVLFLQCVWVLLMWTQVFLNC